MSRDRSKELAALFKKMHEQNQSLIKDNQTLKTRLSDEIGKRNEEKPPLLDYVESLGIKNKEDFQKFFKQSNQKEEDMGVEEKELMQKILAGQEKMNERLENLESAQDETSKISANILATSSKREVAVKVAKLDKGEAKYFLRYLEDIGESKALKVKEDAVEKIHEYLKDNPEETFEDAVKQLDGYYKENFSHYMKIAEDDEQSEENKKQLKGEEDKVEKTEDKSKSIPEESSADSKEEPKKDQTDEEKEIERVSKLSEAEQNKYFQEEALKMTQAQQERGEA